MFFILFFSCDVDVPNLTFENEGRGELWQGGTVVDTATEINDDVEQENTNTESQSETGCISDTGTVAVQDTGQ